MRQAEPAGGAARVPAEFARGGETRELHVAAGVEVLHEPREWPEYHPGYYAVFLRDPDGHNVEAVHHG